MGLETAIERPAVLNKGLMICAGAAAIGFLSSFFTKGITNDYMVAQGLPAEAVAASGGMTNVMVFVALALNLLCGLYFKEESNHEKI